MICHSSADIHQETSGVKWLRLQVCTSLNVLVLLDEGRNGDVYIPFVRIWVTEPLQSSNAIFSILRRIQVLECAGSTDIGHAAKCGCVDGKRMQTLSSSNFLNTKDLTRCHVSSNFSSTFQKLEPVRTRARQHIKPPVKCSRWESMGPENDTKSLSHCATLCQVCKDCKGTNQAACSAFSAAFLAFSSALAFASCSWKKHEERRLA